MQEDNDWKRIWNRVDIDEVKSISDILKKALLNKKKIDKKIKRLKKRDNKRKKAK